MNKFKFIIRDLTDEDLSWECMLKIKDGTYYLIATARGYPHYGESWGLDHVELTSVFNESVGNAVIYITEKSKELKEGRDKREKEYIRINSKQ